MPDVVVIAGPNGAGKSTLAPALLRDTFGITEYVNADVIAEGLSAFAPENAAIDAGRAMLTRLNELTDARQDFAFETTLATRTYARRLKALQTIGYNVCIIYLWLSSDDFAVERVKARVLSGGHNIPEETIRRRYEQSLKYLFELYIPIADSWKIFDGRFIPLNLIAEFSDVGGLKIKNEHLWDEISS
ncbi:MAG: zeta toxin family protein [Acidobacteria bacterium]|nr:zeta toxin family protein [Acidobacteriota bacterium]